jgi:perosamine synthetase
MIRYTQPSISELEVAYATDAVRNGWGDKCYDYINRFEADFATFVGTKYAHATSSCTGAIHLALAALDLKPEDEVILADVNWIASAAPITYLQAKPVFVDILPDTWCIDPRRVEAAITPKTKAIIAVHLYGNVCDVEALQNISAKHGIALIEDCAESLGSTWKGHATGTFGRCGVFSFHGTKTITTGEGGMLVTNDEGLYKTVKSLNSHGRVPEQRKHFWPDMIGYKYRMSNVQAAIGCAQLERVHELIKKKRDVFHYYAKALSNLPEISLNPEPPDTINAYWMPTAVYSKASGITRENLLHAFSARNIDARPFFYPLSSLPMFEVRADNTVSYDIPNRSINLPSSPDMSTADQDKVIAVLQSLLK